MKYLQDMMRIFLVLLLFHLNTLCCLFHLLGNRDSSWVFSKRFKYDWKDFYKVDFNPFNDFSLLFCNWTSLATHFVISRFFIYIAGTFNG